MSASSFASLEKVSALIQDERAGGWWAFDRPLAILRADRLDQVREVIREAERRARRDGCWQAGYIAYEAGPAFDAALHARAPNEGLPFAWFASYAPPRLVQIGDRPMPTLPALDWAASVERHSYDAAIARIRRLIEEGDTYQVNYSLRMRAAFAGDPYALFLAMQGSGASRYGAWLDCGRFVLCSASPELFLRLDEETIVSRPMKGTAPRGRWLDEDEARAAALRTGEKDRAENVMIVDMVRNDLARIAQPGSVRVPSLFECERYPTLWQMTSAVAARTSASLDDILAATFPPASITGAPKARTSAIIAELETTPRGVYTGSIGFIAPGRRAQFNVAIRTAVVDTQGASVEYGVGSGVVWDSRSATEYDECLLKARIVTQAAPPFALLETMLWEREGGYFLLERHLARLARSARYFGFRADGGALRARLAAEAHAFDTPRRRVRLTVERDGEAHVASMALDAQPSHPVRLRLAGEPVDASDCFLFNKTTQRAVYDAARAQIGDADDAVLWNVAGEITETTIANLVIERDGRRLTPALECGLLPGVFRAHLLEAGEIEEGRLSVDDLHRASRIWVINSVRQWREARVVA